MNNENYSVNGTNNEEGVLRSFILTNLSYLYTEVERKSSSSFSILQSNQNVFLYILYKYDIYIYIYR